MNENPYESPNPAEKASDTEPLWRAVLFRALPSCAVWGIVTGLLMSVVSDGIAPPATAALAAAAIVGLCWWWLERPGC